MDSKIIKKHLEDGAHHFMLSLHKEHENTKLSVDVIRKYINTGNISDDEEHLLKVQMADMLKILGIGVPFVLIPGASVIIPILVKVASKHNIDLLPSVI
jgi:hypothetical protein